MKRRKRRRKRSRRRRRRKLKHQRIESRKQKSNLKKIPKKFKTKRILVTTII